MVAAGVSYQFCIEDQETGCKKKSIVAIVVCLLAVARPKLSKEDKQIVSLLNLTFLELII